MSIRTGIVAMSLLASWSCGLAAEAASQPAVPLGQSQRYFNLKEGYSLCPPADADRLQERAASRSITWTARDRATGAIAWTLRAMRQPTDLTEDQIEAHARQINQETGTKDNTQVESCQVITAAGRKAIDMHLVLIHKDRRLWNRQVHILAAPKELLILSIAGPTGDRDQLLAIHQAVLDSLELIDPQALAAQREKNLAAGRELLAALTVEKITAAIDVQDHWTLLLHHGKEIGFSVTRLRPQEANGHLGVECKSWMMKHPPGGPAETFEVISFAAADRSVENWTVAARTVPAAESNAPSAEQVQGLAKQGTTILYTEMSGGKSIKPIRIVLAESMDRCYLPVAFRPILGRLADLGKPASYAFASYTARADGLDVYAFSVIGPEEIELDGQKVQAVRVVVRPAEDVEETSLWLDPAGRFLQQQMAPGTIVQRSTRQEVLKRFPAAQEMLAAIDADQASQPAATRKAK
jgi:hypothetical protein